jgi:hypothetical protein
VRAILAGRYTCSELAADAAAPRAAIPAASKRAAISAAYIAALSLQIPTKTAQGSQIKTPRGRASAHARTQCDADVEAITHPNTHIYIHTYNTYMPGMFYVSLWPARELRAALVYGARCLSWRFGCLHSSVLWTGTKGKARRANCLPCSVCVAYAHYVRTRASVRPSVPFLFTVASTYLHAHSLL